jgi:hypothetical protein
VASIDIGGIGRYRWHRSVSVASVGIGGIDVIDIDGCQCLPVHEHGLYRLISMHRYRFMWSTSMASDIDFTDIDFTDVDGIWVVSSIPVGRHRSSMHRRCIDVDHVTIFPSYFIPNP